MTLSTGERLIILMLTEIYQKLEINGNVDASFVQEAVLGGHHWALEWEFENMLGEPKDPKDVAHVVETLDMWGFIEKAVAQLSPTDRQRLKTDADPFGEDPGFRGFDGNNESELMSIARMLIKKMRRFESFADRELNSHSQTRDSDLRMLKIFLPMRKTLTKGPLNVVQLIEILNARRYPG